MAIGYDGGGYTGDLDAISRALGVEPDIEGVTSRLGTPVDPLGHLQDATILGLEGVPYSDSLLAQLARIDPQLALDMMRARDHGEGLLGQAYMEDPLLQKISFMDDAVGGGSSTINFGQRMGESHDDFLARTMDEDDEDVSDVKKAIDNLDLELKDILPGTMSFEVETPSGTTDIFDTETGEWTALTPHTSRKSAEDDLQKLISLEEETTATDTPTYSWPSIPTAQDTQANVMDEGFLAGLDMTADQSHALTRELNRQRVGGRTPFPHEIEARKQGALINPLTSRYAQTEPDEENQNLIDQVMNKQETSDLYNTGYLEGLSQAMKNVLENDSELMAQYMAARSNIMAQLNKTGYKEHEEFYPGSQAAATQAGFWGPMALGWNDKYNEYKDAQRELMGLQSGQRFMSDDWISNLGWMSPEQINRISGYGAP